MTVVGTPYYMPPEACQSHPQTSKSDIWSLGCVIHELCTLEHTFKADNLLNLVFKIVSEKPEPIPNQYCKELGDLIDLMLKKDPVERPSCTDILKMDIVRQHMKDFVRKRGNTLLPGQKMLKRMPTANFSEKTINSKEATKGAGQFNEQAQ